MTYDETYVFTINDKWRECDYIINDKWRDKSVGEDEANTIQKHANNNLQYRWERGCSNDGKPVITKVKKQWKILTACDDKALIPLGCRRGGVRAGWGATRCQRMLDSCALISLIRTPSADAAWLADYMPRRDKATLLSSRRSLLIQLL